MQGERTIEVTYGDFVDGQKAMADLDNIRNIIIHGRGYADSSIKAVLGIWEDEEDKQE